MGEVRSQEGQNDQAEIPNEPGRVPALVVGEAGGKARHLDGHGRSRGEQEGLEPAARSARRLVVGCQQLLPEPVAVLACELAGQGVEVAHPLHGDQGTPRRA